MNKNIEQGGDTVIEKDEQTPGETEEILIGQATEQQIKEWKGKHGDIFFAKSEGHIGYFKKPNRPEVGYAMSQQGDPLKMTETMLKGCFIGGSRVFIEETGFMLGAGELMEQLISVKKVELGKL